MIFKSICAGISTVFFGMYFNAPKKSLYGNFITGTIGILVYYILENVSGKFIALTASSLCIGLVSEVLTKIFKYPATIYLIPSLLPLVPGLAIFRTMQALAMQDYNSVFSNGLNAIISSTALALGIVISTIFSRSINRVRKQDIKIQIKKIK